MKRIVAVIAMLSYLLVAVPAVAHHMAAEIVSDEIYEMITDLLEDAESPHLYADLTTIPGMIETTVTVPVGMVADILEGLDQFYSQANLDVQVSEEQGGWVTIIIREYVGAGAS